jgi:hypothetical protein
MERALIEEAQEKGFRQQVHDIAAYDYRGQRSPNCNWWQVHDIHMLCMTNEYTEREYRGEDKTTPVPPAPVQVALHVRHAAHRGPKALAHLPPVSARPTKEPEVVDTPLRNTTSGHEVEKRAMPQPKYPAPWIYNNLNTRPGDPCPDKECTGYLKTISITWDIDGLNADAQCSACGDGWTLIEHPSYGEVREEEKRLEEKGGG